MQLPVLTRRRLFLCLLAVLVLFCLNIVRYWVWPPIWPLASNNPETTAFIEYRKSEWAAGNSEKTVRRTWKPLKSISPNLIKAVVIAEDTRFWSHAGFDLTGIREAVERNLDRGRIAAGGSTITQQLAKKLYFSPEKSFVSKLQEALVAIRLERDLSKERILELYLNCVEWGDGVFGAEAAARRYYGIGAGSLTAF